MALIKSRTIDPDAANYRVPELKDKNFHSRFRWFTRRRVGWREFLFTQWKDTGELRGYPENVVDVTGLWICGFSYHTWTKRDKPWGWGFKFGITDDESGIIVQKIAKPSRKTSPKVNRKFKIKKK